MVAIASRTKTRAQAVAERWNIGRVHDFEMLDGQWSGASMVLLRFPSREVFKDFWYGADYAPMKALREEHTRGNHISFAAEFVEPQP